MLAMRSVGDPTTPGFYGPSKTALLLLDFHTHFVEKAGGDAAPAALEVAKKLRYWCKAQGILVIHGLVDIHDEPFPTCKDREKFKSIVARMRSDGGEEAQCLHEGENGDGREEVVFVRKPGYVSALQSPGLAKRLLQDGITSLVLAGLSTSGCVMRTAVAAADAEFVVTVIADGCADPMPGVHDLMLNHVLNNRGYVATSSEFMHHFQEAVLAG